MLILTRRRQEAIKIGHKVTVTILEIKGNQIRLGIEAPSDIPVHRHEIYERIQSENSSMSHVEYKQAMESKKEKHIDNGSSACTTYTTYTVEKEVDGNRLSLSRPPKYEQKADKRNKNIDVRRNTASTTYTTYTTEEEIDGNY